MLREQVITPRAGRGTGPGARGRAGDVAQQRPAKRGGGNGNGGGRAATAAAAGRNASKGAAWRKARAWMPLVGKTLLVLCVVIVCVTAYRTAAASAFFQLRTVDVSGVAQGSEDQLKSLVRRAAATDGVWHADLNAISAELERQPWVRTAVVSRVLPSGLRVRITERVPRAVVRTAAGRFVWVDDDGVQVGAVAPTQNAPAFFMRGWDESGTESGRAENRRRVEKYLELSHEWEAANIASRVSEVNLDDLRDVRSQLTGDDSQIEVRLGKDNLTKRLTQALGALDDERTRAAFITYIDMTQGKRAVIGFKTQASAQNSSNGGGDAATTTNEGRNEKAKPEAAKPVSHAAAPASVHQTVARHASAPVHQASGSNVKLAKSQTTKKADGAPAATTGAARGVEVRPRRVGRSG